MDNIDVTFDFTSDTPFIGMVFGTMNLAIQREIRTRKVLCYGNILSYFRVET